MDIDNMQTVIDAARLGFKPETLAEGKHFKLIYTGNRGVETVNIEPHLPSPSRKKGAVTVFDADSFNALLTANAVPGATTIYVNPDANKPAIVAVINGHGAAGPGWGDFKISIGFRPTPQWEKWKAIDGQMMAQAMFVEFIEDNLLDIATPDGATMLEIASYLQATKTTEFRSGVKLSNGTVQFMNNENIDAQVSAGNIAVPDMFEVALSPIFGVQPFKTPARFRYKIEDRRLKLGFKLQRIETVMETVVKDIDGDIDAIEGVTKVYGVAP